ncbi:MAG: cell division protein FtsZ [Beijerinckiaceae bacterium]|nr:cell division protein FtsZ [Beijerinckiaceae bacterium]
MTITLHAPDIRELKPRITVFGVGGAGGNAVNNMIENHLQGVDFVVANTDAQALALAKAERRIQLGLQVTEGLGAGSQPEVGRAAAEEVMDEIRDQLRGMNMVFIAAGMGGGTGTGAAPVVAQIAREMGILTVGVVTKPFNFEGQRRLRLAESGVVELQKYVDTLIVIPNQNLFRVANQKTTFAEAFAMADQVLYSGVSSITDLITRPSMINLDFADVRAIMQGMGKAMMGTGEASGDNRAIHAAEAAIANPLLDEVSMKGARGLLISITGGPDMVLYEVDEAATRIKEEVDQDANIIFGASQDDSLDGVIRVSVVATGIDHEKASNQDLLAQARVSEVEEKLRQQANGRTMPSYPVPRPAAHAPQPVQAPPQQAAPEPVYELQTPLAPAIEAPRMEEPRVPAPVQQTIAAAHDVALTPVAPKAPARLFNEPVVEEPVVAIEQPREPQAFIPPQAERITRQVRMPDMADLPKPGQAQLTAQRLGATQPADVSADAKRMTIFQRLVHAGFGRREDGEAAPAAQPVQQPSVSQPQPSAAHSEYARRPAAPTQNYRPAQGQLDPQGRQQPASRSIEDEQLEIPAFLRRQSN